MRKLLCELKLTAGEIHFSRISSHHRMLRIGSTATWKTALGRRENPRHSGAGSPPGPGFENTRTRDMLGAKLRSKSHPESA
jgi:hypothetical protein